MPWPCYLCGSEHNSRKGLSSHVCKVHGVKRFERRLCSGTTCLACLRNFWSRDRLIRHVAHSSEKCARVLANRGPVLTEVEAEAEDLGWRVVNRDLVRKGQASTKAVLPYIVLPGPLERDATMEGITH